MMSGYTQQEWNAIKAIATGQMGDASMGPASMQHMDTATARGLLSLYNAQPQAAAPAPTPAPMQQPAAAPVAPPPQPQQQMLNQGGGMGGVGPYQQQFYNMLQGFYPMTQGMYGLGGNLNGWFPQYGRQQAMARPQGYGQPVQAGQPQQNPGGPISAFAARYGNG